MNIFYLDRCPGKAAKYHCDKHVVKMILESAQLLSSVHHLHPNKDNYDPDQLYRLTHKNHPCAIWARKNTGNYSWLCSLADNLLREYTYRYQKIHKTTRVINYCMGNFPNIQKGIVTSPPLAMPDEYKTNCPIESYKQYYLGEKFRLLKYTRREAPEWI